MTKDGRRQGERRQEGRRQGDRREGERRQYHDKKTYIELAKHIGVISVGLFYIIHGIVGDGVLIAQWAQWNLFIYISILCVFLSFYFSVWVILMQLPYCLGFEVKAKNIKIAMWFMVGPFVIGVFLCATFLLVPLFPW